MIVDDDAGLQLEPTPGEEADVWLDPDADHGEERLDHLGPTWAGAGQHASVRVELLDLLARAGASTPCSV